MQPLVVSPRIGKAIEAQVLSWGTVRAWPEQLATWRKQPDPMPPEPVTPSTLKHSEEQSVAALWAVCEAIAGIEPKGTRFTDWGVIAAPRFCGRTANAVSSQRFLKEGAWGVSPNVIPHQSMHAVSGTISQILKIHGPNFGVGNGWSSTSEGWLLAATMLSEGYLPGLWFVLTGHTGEFLPEGADCQASRLECEAVAFALVPKRGIQSGLCVRICPEEASIRDPENDPFLGAMPAFSLSQLVDELRRPDGSPAAMWRLPGAGWVEVEMR